MYRPTRPFILVGKWAFAVDAITAINIDDESANFTPSVSVRVIGDEKPWYFAYGTPEANALVDFVANYATTLAPLPDK